MRLCGDLLRFQSKYLDLKTKTKMVQLNKNINYLCNSTYIKINYVDYEEYKKMPSSLQCNILKLKNVNESNGLPNHITHLRFGKHFNKEVNSLPKGLTHLQLGNNFN